MRQRVMIAMALACKSEVLLADEPTTALDVTVQAQILQLLRQLQQETGMAIAFITHDLAVVAELCDRVVVMYGGKVFESTDVNTLFAHPGHPYTQALLESLPDRAIPGQPLVSIPGQPPTSGQRGTGCPFKSRCRVAMSACDSPLPLVQLGTIEEPQLVACHRVSEVAGC
jgi:oligopeptide transport system ATP-binding protein